MAGECQFGVTGLAVMGQNLARNVAGHGFPVAVHNRTTARTDEFYAAYGDEGPITPTRTIEEFVGARPEDRIGLMLFAARPYTQCPLTLDHSWLVENLERARVGMIEHGTAIGSAVAAALRHLRTSAAGSKFIIVLTDGSNNAGRITPLAAAEAAAALGVKVYTIGAGTPGAGPSFGQRIFGRVIPELEFDEETLQKMAAATGARYFRATDMPSLHAGFAEIDRYEKRSLVTRKFIAGRELYPWLLWPALGVLLLEIGLAETVLRKLP